MSEVEQHQKIKYGDIIYIEFTYKKKKDRNILNGGDFTLNGKFDVEIKELDFSNKLIESIYLKDFEDNLFLIFPKMKDEFMNNKTFVNNGLSSLKEKIKTSKGLTYDSEFKNNVTKVIKAFQQTKENVYSENEKFMEDIGKPINYEDDFILIHFKTHCFVKRNANINNKSSALILSPDYTDECIFFFAQSSYFNLNLKNVFSNQNVFICKREKNIWSNSHFLIVKPVAIEKTKNENTNNILEKRKDSTKNELLREVNNLAFEFNEGQGQVFQIKIYSNYIDPSSSNLTFATPVWLSVQSIERYLNITILSRGENNDYEPINPPNNKTDNGINNLNFNINSAGNYSLVTHSINPTKTLTQKVNFNINNDTQNLNIDTFELRKTKSNLN